MSENLIEVNAENFETICGLSVAGEKATEGILIPVSNAEVKRAYLLANTLKGVINSEGYSIQRMEEEYESLRNDIEALGISGIDDGIFSEYPKRLHQYNSLNWHRGRISLASLGVWPRMGGIDIRLCQKNLPDTAEKIKQVRGGDSYLDVPEKVFGKIDSMQEKMPFIMNRLPLIVVPGGEIRSPSYEGGARSSGHDGSLLEHTLWDIDDGNHRAVSHSLLGFKYAPAYIGMRG